MSILGNDLLLAGTDEGYNLTRSLRFRSSASAYLNRTPSSAVNQKTWTWSCWVKRGTISNDYQYLLSAFYYNSSPYYNYQHNICFTDTDNLRVLLFDSSTNQANLITTQVFRDPSAWYHIQVVWDTTQSTSSNRVKIYVNGAQVTSFSTATYPPQNYDGYINSTYYHSIGVFTAPPNYSGIFYKFDGYMAETNFISGQALTPSSFGETDTITGVWKPKRYAGTYGTNGFYLPFTDNSALTTSSNAGLGKDFSGNGNYWTTNNISITSGTTYDSMTDVPTLTSATAANFAVLNPLNSFVNGPNATLSNGNLLCSSGIYQAPTLATMQLPTTGKYYWEITVSTVAELAVGINAFATASPLTGNYSTRTVYYRAGGASNSIYIEGTVNAFAAASYTNGDVIAVAYDATTPSITFYKNNVSQGTYTLTSTANLYPYLVQSAGSGQFVAAANFGQRPFTYTPPTGYVALNTYNLPTSTILQGNTVMDATLWTGNGTTQTITNSAGFKPDFVWLKSRGATYISNNNNLFDSVRGANKALFSDLTNAEITYTDRMNSFNSNGFTVASGYNANNGTFVGWQWQAGQGTTSTNTNGTITSTVSVNASAGFSVVTYTGNGSAGATIGHGLGVAPSWIFVKSRSATGYWLVYSSVNGNTKYMTLNTSDAVLSSSGAWNNTSPTSSVFSVGSSADVNTNGTTYVAYCFAPIAGYSAFGSYTGNGSSDGPFVYTGFRPKFVLIKSTTSVNDWIIEDTARNTYNVSNSKLSPNTSGTEFTYTYAVGIDFLSNGFKIKGTDGSINTSNTYIYAAFAENPFKNALAR